MISNLFTEVVMAVVLCYVIYVKKGQIKGTVPTRYPKIKKSRKMPKSLSLFSLSLCARKNKKVHRRNVSCVVYKIDKSSTKKSRFQELYDQGERQQVTKLANWHDFTRECVAKS